MLLTGLLTLLYLTAAEAATKEDRTAEELRKEIQSLEARVREAEAGKLTAVEQLQDIERKIELRRRLIIELERKAELSNSRIAELGRQVTSVEREIQNLSADLSEEEANLEALKRQVGERMSFFYKRMAGARLAMIVGAKNARDLSRRRKYIAAIESFDRNAIEALAEQRDKVAGTRTEREKLRGKLSLDQAKRLTELEQYRLLIRDRRVEEEASYKERAAKQSLVRKIEGDADLLKAMLENRRKALEEIEREIRKLQDAPKRKDIPDWSPGVPFSALAGKLIWPTPGESISQPFGPSKHPKLGTVTVNPGIDIRAAQGDPVRSVAGGQITRITWLRGFGSTVIISHGEGYYTVYARLGEISVREGDVVRPGQMIGQVGDAAGSSGFHFELWAKREKQDPLKWLKR